MSGAEVMGEKSGGGGDMQHGTALHLCHTDFSAFYNDVRLLVE